MRQILSLIAVAFCLSGCGMFGGAGGQREHVEVRPVLGGAQAQTAAARQAPAVTAETGRTQAKVEVKTAPAAVPAPAAPAAQSEQKAVASNVVSAAHVHWMMSDHGLPLVAAGIIVLSIITLLVSHFRQPHPVNGHVTARRPNGEVAARHLQI
jgi:hypothetical protein